MRTPVERARRWLAQAENELRLTGSLFESGFWSGACFHAEQTAQLALKAYLYWKGRRFINIHSIRLLVRECSQEDPEFLNFEDYGSVLDRYYLATRYPDVLPEPAVPFESFTRQEAQQAMSNVAEIVETVRNKVGPTGQETTSGTS